MKNILIPGLFIFGYRLLVQGLEVKYGDSIVAGGRCSVWMCVWGREGRSRLWLWVLDINWACMNVCLCKGKVVQFIAFLFSFIQTGTLLFLILDTIYLFAGFVRLRWWTRRECIGYGRLQSLNIIERVYSGRENQRNHVVFDRRWHDTIL